MEANEVYIALNNQKAVHDILFRPKLDEDGDEAKRLLIFRTKLLLDYVSNSRGESLDSPLNSRQLKYILDTMLMQERIINLNTFDSYFVEAESSYLVDPVSPRNELQALHSVIRRTGSSISCNKHNEPLLDWIHNAAVDLIDQVGKKFGEVTTVIRESSCEKENYLLQWSKNNGVNTKLEIAYVEGSGRGAIAIENLKIGDVALEIPVSLIISEKNVRESDMFPILEKIDDISSETMLLLWSMKEKHNPDSKYKFYFDSLPEAFNTGLCFGKSAGMALDGTTVLVEKIIKAKQDFITQHKKLFPALCQKHPDAFPAKFYTFKFFLWAWELWSSNSLKIMFEDGKLQTCLVPIAGFLNHSTCPHILHHEEVDPVTHSVKLHHGKVDPVTHTVKFPLSRPCNAGEQCFLSYGDFSSSHLVTFYGFMPKQENPLLNMKDVIELESDADEGIYVMKDSPKLRGTWFPHTNGLFQYGLPPPILYHLPNAQWKDGQWKDFLLALKTRANLETQPQRLQTQLKKLGEIRVRVEDRMKKLGDDDAEANDRDGCDWDLKLALDFKDLQRRILASVISSCKEGCKLLRHELSICKER